MITIVRTELGLTKGPEQPSRLRRKVGKKTDTEHMQRKLFGRGSAGDDTTEHDRKTQNNSAVDGIITTESRYLFNVELNYY